MNLPSPATLGPQPWLDSPAVKAVMAALAGEVRFVGGCVRDALLGRPVKDLDMATPLVPDQILKACEAAGLKSIPTGIAHGTVTVVAHGTAFEITTLRRDLETDGRHAVVAFTTDWAEDAARRDFTMNALSADSQGRVYDYFTGLEDLEAGRVKFVGDPKERLQEDKLRLLRYFRFCAHYSRLGPESKALAACQAFAPDLAQLSGERIRQEMLRLLEAPTPARWLGLLQDHGILDHALPNVRSLDVLNSLQALDQDDPDPLRRLAACLPADRDALETLTRQWRFSNLERKRLETALFPAFPVPDHGDQDDLRRALYAMGREGTLDHLLLSTARSDDSENWAGLIEALALVEVPVFPLQGKDILDLGIPAGPGVGEKLNAVEAWWLGGGCRADYAACLAYARSV